MNIMELKPISTFSEFLNMISIKDSLCGIARLEATRLQALSLLDMALSQGIAHFDMQTRSWVAGPRGVVSN